MKLRVIDVQVPLLIHSLTVEERNKVKSLLQPGDILLKDDNSHPMGQIANRLARSRWSHSAFYPGGDKVVDVGTKPYVAKVDLDQFLQCSDIGVFRPRYTGAADLQSALDYVQSSLGRPLNRSFSLQTKNAYYCAQLIYCALGQMPQSIEIPLVNVLGRPFVTSSCIETCPDIETVFIKRTGLVQRIAGHAPTILPTVLGGFLGSYFGWPGTLLCALASFIFVVFVGNGISHKNKGEKVQS